jgi:hypothetical protein
MSFTRPLLRSYQGWSPAAFLAVSAYLAAVKERPEWKKVQYGEDLIISGWKRHKDMAHK